MYSARPRKGDGSIRKYARHIGMSAIAAGAVLILVVILILWWLYGYYFVIVPDAGPPTIEAINSTLSP